MAKSELVSSNASLGRRWYGDSGGRMHGSTAEGGWRALQVAGVVYAFGTLIHSIDHFRRGTESVTPEVKILGAIFTVAAVVALALIFSRNRFAPLFVVVVGLAHGIGILKTHWLPHFGALSDSFVSNQAELVSWVAVAVEVAGAFAVGLVGLAMLSRGWARMGSAGAALSLLLVSNGGVLLLGSLAG